MDFLSLTVSIITLLIPAFVVYIARVGNFRTVKNEGKCFLVVIAICAYYGYKRSFLFSMLVGSSDILMPIMGNLVIGIILGFANMFAAKQINRIMAEKEQRNKEANLASDLKQNNWEFPCLEFYNLCKETGVSLPDDSEFIKMKLQKAVQYILEKHNVPSEYWDKFLENGAEYYRNAEAALVAEANKIAEEKQKHDTTLVAYTPDKEEKRLLDGISFLRKLHGLDKRRAMLKNEISALMQRRTQISAELNGASQPVSVNLQKEKSWATWGGVADAIAGPAAGLATALHIQQQNQKNQEQNIAMLNAASYLEGVRKKNAERLQKALVLLNEEIGKLENLVDKLPLKIVLPTPVTNDIMKGMTLDNIVFTKRKSGILEVSADAKCVISKETLPAASMVVDGAIHAKVFLQDQFVEDIYLLLPRDGIFIDGENFALHSLCTTALPVEADYRLELGPDSNLWIMEK